MPLGNKGYQAMILCPKKNGILIVKQNIKHIIITTMNVSELEKFRTQSMPVLMRKVYTWMAMALVITGICAYGVAASPSLVTLIFSGRFTFYGLIFAEYGNNTLYAVCSTERCYTVGHFSGLWHHDHRASILHYCRNVWCNGLFWLYHKERFVSNGPHALHGSFRFNYCNGG